MTFEELNRAMEFIVEQQARLSATLDRDHEWARNVIGQLALGNKRILELIESNTQRLDQNDKEHREFAETQKKHMEFQERTEIRHKEFQERTEKRHADFQAEAQRRHDEFQAEAQKRHDDFQHFQREAQRRHEEILFELTGILRKLSTDERRPN